MIMENSTFQWCADVPSENINKHVCITIITMHSWHVKLYTWNPDDKTRWTFFLFSNHHPIVMKWETMVEQSISPYHDCKSIWPNYNISPTLNCSVCDASISGNRCVPESSTVVPTRRLFSQSCRQTAKNLKNIYRRGKVGFPWNKGISLP